MDNILDEPKMNIGVQSLSPEALHPGTKITARILEPITEKYLPIKKNKLKGHIRQSPPKLTLQQTALKKHVETCYVEIRRRKHPLMQLQITRNAIKNMFENIYQTNGAFKFNE